MKTDFFVRIDIPILYALLIPFTSLFLSPFHTTIVPELPLQYLTWLTGSRPAILHLVKLLLQKESSVSSLQRLSQLFSTEFCSFLSAC